MTGNRSRRSFLGSVTGIGVGLLGGVARFGGATDGSARVTSQVVDSRQFFGTAYTSLEYRNEDQEVVYADEYENDVSVVLTPPISRSFQRETNPFHLRIDPGGPLIFPDDTIDGEIQVDSAYDFGTELVQYWDIQRERTNEFSGELTTAETGFPPERNWISVFIPGQEVVRPLALSEGSLLDGVVQDGILFATVSGNTTNRNTPFTVEVVAEQE